ncbi:MAG TPA: DNA methyltransferase, partial [Burkholderiaceae bacterium]
LELDVLRAVHEGPGSRFLDIHQEISVDVDQFYGIEIEEFPAQIAQVALWLMDHQMNVLAGEEFGLYFARIPLKATPHIVHGNALRLEWESVLPASRCSFVFGNPPFVGSKLLDDAQRADADFAFGRIAGAGLLDFVAAWYVKATRYMRGANVLHAAPRCAFVSTNSITQGEQVVLLWGWLLEQGVTIHFAHRTFQWRNEARGMAAVHCVIVGFGVDNCKDKVLYEYDDIRGEPHAVPAARINPYLVDAADVLAVGHARPISKVSAIVNGSIPADGGHLLLDCPERDALLADEPQAARFIRPYAGAEDFIHGLERYCLWLADCPPALLRQMPRVVERVRAVKAMREASAKAATRAKAATPTLFTENRQPLAGNYLAVPRTSSENRRYLPIGFLPHTTIAANDLQIVPGATGYEFGVLSSAMHIAWARTTAGRLESRIRYSTKYTYNAFPWPESPTDKQRDAIELAAQSVLDTRAQFPGSTLADLYDPLTMPPALLKAHHKLDAVVDAAYGRKGFKSDAERVAFLFELYRRYTSLLPADAPKPKRVRTTGA